MICNFLPLSHETASETLCMNSAQMVGTRWKPSPERLSIYEFSPNRPSEASEPRNWNYHPRYSLLAVFSLGQILDPLAM